MDDRDGRDEASEERPYVPDGDQDYDPNALVEDQGARGGVRG